MTVTFHAESGGKSAAPLNAAPVLALQLVSPPGGIPPHFSKPPSQADSIILDLTGQGHVDLVQVGDDRPGYRIHDHESGNHWGYYKANDSNDQAVRQQFRSGFGCGAAHGLVSF